MNSQSQTREFTDAIAHDADGNVLLELTARSWTFPLRIASAGQALRAYVRMSPHSAEESKPLIAAMQPKTTIAGDVLRVEPGENLAALQLFDAHFVELLPGPDFSIADADGNPSTAPQQRAYFDAHEYLKIRAVMEGWAGVMTAKEQEEAPWPEHVTGKRLLRLDLAQHPVEIPLRQPLWCAEHSREETYTVTHRLRAVTSREYLEYERATGIAETNTRSGYRVRADDLDALEKLYGDAAQSLAGAVAGGKACDERNTKLWLPLVPLWHKLFVVHEVMGRIRAKNG